MLRINNINVSYENTNVLKGISIELNKGDICCLLGESGSGKTTILRSIAGFVDIQDGNIHVNNKLVQSNKFSIKPFDRYLGYVFQDYALFPHLTILKNILFGLKKLDKDEAMQLADQYMQLLNIQELKNRYPHEISGGQQQRVALARTLVTKPKLLLLDEPFSNIDAIFRYSVSKELRKILKDLDITVLMVTHDREEAISFGDKIGILKDGLVEQLDSPTVLLKEPSSEYIVNFMNAGNVLKYERSGDKYLTIFGEITSSKDIYPIDDSNIMVPFNRFNVTSNGKECKVLNCKIVGQFIEITLIVDDNKQIKIYLPNDDNIDLNGTLKISVL